MRETLWRVFDRKLRALLRHAGIELCQLEDQVVERTPQIVGDFADKDRDSHGGVSPSGQIDGKTMWRLRLEIGECGLVLLLPHGIDVGFEIRKVFACPIYSCKSASQRVRGHAIIPA